MISNISILSILGIPEPEAEPQVAESLAPSDDSVYMVTSDQDCTTWGNFTHSQIEAVPVVTVDMLDPLCHNIQDVSASVSDVSDRLMALECSLDCTTATAATTAYDVDALRQDLDAMRCIVAGLTA